ncbi:hypothetical protein ACE41H_25250, partial [Paenibacillus enshidis]
HDYPVGSGTEKQKTGNRKYTLGTLKQITDQMRHENACCYAIQNHRMGLLSFWIVPYGEADRFEVMRRSSEKAERLGDETDREREGGSGARHRKK